MTSARRRYLDRRGADYPLLEHFVSKAHSHVTGTPSRKRLPCQDAWVRAPTLPTRLRSPPSRLRPLWRVSCPVHARVEFAQSPFFSVGKFSKFAG